MARTPRLFQTFLDQSKSPSPAYSLYQKCSGLRDKLLKIRGFKEHFPELTSSSATDPITQLWSLFSMGTPLCYIFDQLPPEDGFKKLGNYSLSKRVYEPNLNRAKKHAIALFVMQLENLLRKIPECEMFTVTDLWNGDSMDGMVKVVNTVTAIVNYLPKNVFDYGPFRDSMILYVLESERRYIQDLEIMQRLANALSQSNMMDQETIHLLFPNLNQLVKFHRKFLIQLEITAQLPLQFQRWGQQFIQYEEEFSVYEPYCVNYKNATRLMLGNEKAFAALSHMIDIKSKLPGLLLSPIRRVYDYPLLLGALTEDLTDQGYDHQDELIRGSEAAKRVIGKINKAHRWYEKQKLVQNLQTRVQDWKGHHPANFGDLLLHDVFMVKKANVDRLRVVYLFQKVLIFMKLEGSQQPWLEKKIAVADLLEMSSPTGSTPLVLKSLVFLGNLVSVMEFPTRTNAESGHYPILITWKAGDGTDTATMKCARKEQMERWRKILFNIIQWYKSKPVQLPSQLANPSPLELPLRHSSPPPLDSRNSTDSNLKLTLSSPQKEGYYDDAHEGDLQRERQPDDEVLSDSDNDLEYYPPPSYPPSGRDTPFERHFLTRSCSLPSRSHFGLSQLSTSKGGQTHLRVRSNSLPAGMPIFSDATSERSDREHTPPKTPQASNRSLPPIAKDLFQSPSRAQPPESASVKLKVHLKDDLLVILVPRMITYDDLIERIKHKCRFCGPLPDGPFKVKYRDEDGDLVSLTSTEDVQLAFEKLEPGKYVYFYVS